MTMTSMNKLSCMALSDHFYVNSTRSLFVKGLSGQVIHSLKTEGA